MSNKKLGILSSEKKIIIEETGKRISHSSQKSLFEAVKVSIEYTLCHYVREITNTLRRNGYEQND